MLDTIGGESVAPDALGAPKARDLARKLARGALPYARLVECRRAARVDVVVLEVDVEVVQRRVHDIRPTERLAVVFHHADRLMPKVLPLRDDFPVVPHTNLEPPGWPRSLCLFDERYRDLKPRWTSARFVARIREWLRLTARGELHATDQPLEPLLGDIDGVIILPHDLFKRAEGEDDATTHLRPLSVVRRPDHRRGVVLVATRASVSSPAPAAHDDATFVATAITCRPQPHGVMRHAPGTLNELHEILAGCGIDLLGHLRDRLYEWKEATPQALDACLVLVVCFPKTRETGGRVEASDVWAFVTAATVREVGAAVGRWALHDGIVAALIGGVDTARDGADVEIGLLNPAFTLSREAAAKYNGQPAPSDLLITAVGCGALGSQVVLNAARAAFGRWVLIDDDLLLPHNLARNGLDQSGVAWPKAQVLAVTANSLTDGAAPMTSIVADVVEPGADAAAVADQLRSADAIVDMSASLTVARHLARNIDAAGRRVSIFLNPTGSDVTILAEDRERHLQLDLLEMQYYRAVVQRPELAGHLRPPPERVRYGRSCRDVSVQLPQELVALHAAIGTRALRAALEDDGATMRVWRADEATLAVNTTVIEPAAVHAYQLGEWTVYADAWLLARLTELRAAKLPNETGGVLLGTFDVERKIAYLVDTIPSPPDSQEWPVLYIRGCAGLPEAVRSVEEATAGQLHYIGEWHSHPDGCSCRPSLDDVQVFTWLTDHMDADGLPALMFIVGEDGAVPYLGRMLPPELVDVPAGATA